ncbi:flavin-nucleotide-binding protein [Vibrio orientalis CIP 102891 = ATCC 33934]|uniref:Flavin-nucleotide-binding protein n=1 Tax=Vibrio orientalis CIP 102891 = ATCC 33934 TaxID=675816 RepID=C9QHG9_VIBOR|nr:pyridoxamine 5'-phosphate oxidase family protein [Vibrio orientalis]EEX93700.1 predicted flavin-nucleotide-binding protein [Vibrio orientalis CIP 102891 = ATCC 33934]EGU51125.1 flavin-nucleotide-binding protein [Vibrio orientalis CIP 102891 = ATCC 33934]
MLSTTPRTEIRKGAHKAVTETQTLYDIIDESLVAHIAIGDNEQPFVIPMLAWRVADKVYIHGANNSRLMRNLRKGASTCLTFTLFDGWVLARSAFHHSAHYRSAVVLGHFTAIEESAEKDRLLNHFIEQIAPGRTDEVRLSNQKELDATMLLEIPLTEASVKVSKGNVNDDLGDMQQPVFAGYLPYRTVVGPLAAEEDSTHSSLPDYSSAYPQRWHQRA